MASIIEDGALAAAAARNRYPWADWLDGRTWELTRADFPGISRRSFQTTAQSAAARRGKRIITSWQDGRLLLRAVKR